jgi:hypothetical protein
MKYFITMLFCAIMMFNSVATADIALDALSSEWTKLTAVQKAKLAGLITEEASSATSLIASIPPSVDAEKIEPWLKLIGEVGDGMVELAHALGVEANELIKTPIGILAMCLVVYHVMGSALFGIAGGLLWFSLTMPFLILFYFKSVIPIVEYKEVNRSLRSDSDVTIVASKPIRRRMTFGDGDEDEGSVDWVFTVLLVLTFFVTIMFLA